MDKEELINDIEKEIYECNLVVTLGGDRAFKNIQELLERVLDYLRENCN